MKQQTGFKRIDQQLGGIKQGELFVLVGNSSNGKSKLSEYIVDGKLTADLDEICIHINAKNVPSDN